MINEVKKAQENSFFLNSNYVQKDKSHFFSYWRYRFLRPLIKLQYKTFRFLNKPAPWLSPTATMFLKKHLTKEMVGVEFGSGISTLFLAPKVKHLISIEHNKEWYEIVNEKLKVLSVSVDYRFISEQEPSQEFKKLDFYDEFDIPLELKYKTEYYNYFRAIDDCEDASIDFIIVDGRARPECVFSSYKKLKKGGLMILDNSERPRYRIVFEKLKHLDSYTTTNGLTDTTFWQKN